MKTSQRNRFWDGFRYAGEGLWYVICTQFNFRFHVFVAAIVIGIALWLDVSALACAILLLTIGIVLVAEVLNTAVEALVDLVSPDYNALAKNVKDVAAGAVLLAAALSVVVGLIILGPPLLLRIVPLIWGPF